MTSTVSKALRNIVAERDSYTCVLCDNGYTDMHHVTPRSQGGRNNPHNLVSLCRRCHMMLHRELPVDSYWRKFGWTDIREWTEYAEQRLIEYTADFYAEEHDPIEHDSFTIYSANHHPIDNAPKLDWNAVSDAQKRFVGQYWDKDKRKWITVLTKD